MSRYNKDIYEGQLHGKANIKVGVSGSSGFETGGGNAISASYLFGDGSGLSGISAGGGSAINVSGTPADNQITVWTASDTVEGTTNLTFDTTKGLNVVTTPAIGNFSDGDVTGEVIKFGSGTTTAGQIHFLWTDSNWYRTDSDNPLWSGTPLLGVALGTSPTTHGMLIRGLVRVDTGNVEGSPAIGKPVYVSEVNGKFDFTEPSAGGASRAVGHCLANSSGDVLIMFDPSRDFKPLDGTRSNLWYPPSVSHADDDEFDSNSLSSDWGAYNQDDDTGGTFDTSTAIDFYGTFNSGDAIRVSADSTYKPSWLRVQVPARSKYYLITKDYTFPTNILIWARLNFAQEDQSNVTNNDGTIGLAITANSSGNPDVSNLLELYMNEPDTDSIKAVVWRREGGSWAQVGGFTDTVASEGQALEYAAIHKVGSNYHLWVGTESNWIYLQSTTLSFTPAKIGFVFQNVNVAPTLVSSIDFIRFIETDKWPF